MLRSLFLLCFTLALTVTPALAVQNETATAVFTRIPASRPLKWYPCQGEFFCALLDVPLDYAKPDGTRASVPLIKYPAANHTSKGAYKGMILLNPGGPGGSGVSFLIADGAPLSRVIGTNYDFVAFDPRGIGSSVPLANCSVPEASLPLQRRLPKILGPELPDSTLKRVYNQVKPFGRACEAAMGGRNDAGPHMSTAVVARDMVSIVDAFARSSNGRRVKNAHLLNYLGFSYGTFIGETFGSLFPHRVGRVALDGVLDPEIYTSSGGVSSIEFLDDVFSAYFVYCHAAGPRLCPYYTGNSPVDIYNRFESSFTQLDSQYAVAHNWTNATVIENALAVTKSLLIVSVYRPIDDFPRAAPLLLALEGALKNHTLENFVQQALSQLGPASPSGIEASLGVFCSDKRGALYNRTFDELISNIRVLEKQSVIGGENFAQVILGCAGWPIKGVDVYTGPFGGETKNPILFVSNTLDPVTPITNARRWFPRYKGAQLLTIEAIGHTSTNAENLCGYAKIAAFFQTGQLPGKDSFCPLEKGPFNITLPTGGLAKRNDYQAIRSRMPKLWNI